MTVSGGRAAGMLRKRSLQALVGLCAVAAVLFSACGGSSPRATESNSGISDVSTGTPTSVAEPEPESDPGVIVDDDIPITPTSTPEPEQEDFRFFSVEPDATWQAVFDNLTAPEQSCIRDALGGELRESAMALPVFGIFEDPSSRQWEAEMISCLLPESAQIVFLPRFIAMMSLALRDELGVEGSVETDLCMRDRVFEMGIGAVTSAFTEGDDAAVRNLIFTMMACEPELFYTSRAEAMGVEPMVLNEEEQSCIREWADSLDESERTLFLSPKDNPAVLTELGIGMIACTPDLLIDSLGSELGMEMSALSDSEEACLQDWIRNLDAHQLVRITEDDPEAIAGFGLGFITCIPEFFVTAFAAGIGMETPALSDSEEACLQDWIMDLDVDGLLVMMFPEDNPNAALLLGFELFVCVPELLPPDFAVDRIEETV